jgi:hypothetical protein
MALQISQIGSVTLNEENIIEAETHSGGGETATCTIFGALGITSSPYPTNDSGYCEAIIDDRFNTIISLRDTRVSNVVGNITPGDSAVHSTGPTQASRIFLKEDAKTIALMEKDSKNKDFGIVIDGTNDKITMLVGGTSVFEISKNKITLAISDGSNSSSIILTPAGAQLNTAAVNLSGYLSKFELNQYLIASVAAAIAGGVPADGGKAAFAAFLATITPLLSAP